MLHEALVSVFIARKCKGQVGYSLYTTIKCYITVLYHTIENIVANTINKVHNGKVRHSLLGLMETRINIQVNPLPLQYRYLPNL